jgi:hypothetical protein
MKKNIKDKVKNYYEILNFNSSDNVVYFLTHKETDKVKIGRTKNFTVRWQAYNTSFPSEPILIGIINCGKSHWQFPYNMFEEERKAKKYFKNKNSRLEWFKISNDEACDYIDMRMNEIGKELEFCQIIDRIPFKHYDIKTKTTSLHDRSEYFEILDSDKDEIEALKYSKI